MNRPLSKEHSGDNVATEPRPKGRRLQQPTTEAQGGIQLRESITVYRNAGELYRFWRNLENLIHCFSELESIHVRTEKISTWKIQSADGFKFQWDAEIINETENELIAWRSLPGSDVVHVGAVRFERAPVGRGTELKVFIQYLPPGGILGSAISKLLGEDPQEKLRIDLHRLKQLLEAGEISTIFGQPSGGLILKRRSR